MIDNFKVSAQWSRRMNSLKLWLTLRVHGRKAYEDMMERQMQLASSMRAWIESSEYFELAAPQTLPILNFRLRGVADHEAEAAHRTFIDEFNRDGRYWISRTRVRGKSVLRMMVISYLSTAEHLAGLQEALQAAAQRVAGTENFTDRAKLSYASCAGSGRKIAAGTRVACAAPMLSIAISHPALKLDSPAVTY